MKLIYGLIPLFVNGLAFSIPSCKQEKIKNDANILISNLKEMKLVRGDFPTVLAEIKQPCNYFVSQGYLLPASNESTVINFGQRYTGVQRSLFRNYDFLAEKYLKIAGHELDSDLKKKLAGEFEQMFMDWLVALQESGGKNNVKMAFYTGSFQECTGDKCNYSFGMVEVEATVDREFNLEMTGINFKGAPKYKTEVDELFMISMLLDKAQAEFQWEGYITDFAVDVECSKYNFGKIKYDVIMKLAENLEISSLTETDRKGIRRKISDEVNNVLGIESNTQTGVNKLKHDAIMKLVGNLEDPSLDETDREGIRQKIVNKISCP